MTTIVKKALDKVMDKLDKTRNIDQKAAKNIQKIDTQPQPPKKQY